MGRGSGSGSGRSGSAGKGPKSSGAGPPQTTPERAERAEIYRAVRQVEAGIAKDSGNQRLVPIHAVRDAVEARLGRAVDRATFDRAIRDLQSRNTHEVLNISDFRNLTPAQLNRSISVNSSNVGAYLLRNQKAFTPDPGSRKEAIARLPRVPRP